MSCNQWPYGSSLRRLCEGTSGLGIAKTNRFRAFHGLEPLFDPDAGTPAKTSDGVTIRAEQTQQTKPAKACCGGSQKTRIPLPNGYGPGSQLLMLFKSAGMPHCDACVNLAGLMDSWGVEECHKKIDLIVSDIMPRAIAWETAKVGWLAALIPESVTRATIAALVRRAINQTHQKKN